MANKTKDSKETPKENPVAVSPEDLTTTEAEEKVADKDTFAMDFLVRFDDSSKVSQDAIDVNKKAVIQDAFMRGLRPTSEPTLTSKKVVDEHNVLLMYSVDVEQNTTDNK